MTGALDATRTVLASYGVAAERLVPLAGGLINQTWLVVTADGAKRVLQRVNALFPAEVNHDIVAVSAHLAHSGPAVPALLPSATGRFWVEHAGSLWRLMTHLEGVSRTALETPAQAAEAGRLLARFHRGLDSLDHQFANPRLGVHDTTRHLQRLRDALDTHREHRRIDVLRPLASTILDYADSLPAVPATPDRNVHGDPKIANMLFDPVTGAGLGMVDLDTVGRMPLPLELGDALRSWCNPAGEDQERGKFSQKLFEAALRGYCDEAAGWLTAAELGAILPATWTIIVELSARFCTDAMNEIYFAWDPKQFASHSEHLQVRAEGQLTLARSLEAQYAELERSVIALRTEQVLA